MRRALAEYRIAGIRTTVPFFTWLLADPSFVDGHVHTKYLDELLRARAGRPFVEPTPDVEDLGAVAAALYTVLEGEKVADAVAANTHAQRWRTGGRLDALR
jgi:acetyl/propionyl-CoA carboxylase alpha subunit